MIIPGVHILKPTSVFTRATVFSLATILALASCGPARWAEYPGANHESGQGGQKPNPGTPATETFSQGESANKVDILIINDNSRSMDSDQRKMSERFGSFISAIHDVDYQIAMTTTDLDSAKWAQHGKILPWLGTNTKILTPETSGADAAFRQTIVRKETIGCGSRNGGRDCPSGNEQPLKAMIMAMDEANGANAGFFRPGVDLVAVVLSDEDEMSTGPANATKPEQVIESFKSHFADSKRFNVHGIVIKPGDAACKASEDAEIPEGKGASYGTHVASLADLTGGTVSSICDSDYSKNLSEISREVQKLISTFELKTTPRPGSVQVVMTPIQNISYQVDGKKVIFATPPVAGTHLEISYIAL
jgi:hypothetical protein